MTPERENDSAEVRNPLLIEFIRARIADDEAATAGHLDNYVQRERAECEAKRRIILRHDVVDAAGGCAFCGEPAPCEHLRILAAVYDDHPDYQQEWKP